MNRILSHCIIQLLIIVLGFLGVAQALPGLCATACLCCSVQESVDSLPECCSKGTGLHAGHEQGEMHSDSVHASAHQSCDDGQVQQHAYHGMAAQGHTVAQDGADCDPTEICFTEVEGNAYGVKLSTTGGQTNTDLDPILAELPEVVHGVADFFVASVDLQPYQAPLPTPPRIYTKNCSFLI